MNYSTEVKFRRFRNGMTIMFVSQWFARESGLTYYRLLIMTGTFRTLHRCINPEFYMLYQLRLI
jgi:hypothetical protein